VHHSLAFSVLSRCVARFLSGQRRDTGSLLFTQRSVFCYSFSSSQRAVPPVSGSSSTPLGCVSPSLLLEPPVPKFGSFYETPLFWTRRFSSDETFGSIPWSLTLVKLHVDKTSTFQNLEVASQLHSFGLKDPIFSCPAPAGQPRHSVKDQWHCNRRLQCSGVATQLHLQWTLRVLYREVLSCKTSLLSFLLALLGKFLRNLIL